MRLPPATSVLTCAALATYPACSDTAERLGEPVEERVAVGRDRGSAIEVDPLANRTLADFLVRAPGMYVSGSGPNARVLLRGRRPLYVFDGVPVGHSYREADALFVPTDVEAVEVLTGPEATLRFGRRAAHGAVVVSTH